MNVHPLIADSKVIEGRMDTVYETFFSSSGVMKIECKAMFKDFMIDKKELGLRKKQKQIVSQNSYSRPSTFGYGGNTQNERQGRIVHSNQEGYNVNMIHSRLLDLLDPKKHMHPGIPYDFYSGYILMVAKNVDMDDDDDENTGGMYLYKFILGIVQ